MNECVYCEGVADFQWLDGGWYVCTGCIKEGKTDTEAIEEGEGNAMKDYGFMLDGGGLICPKCADNPLYKGELDRVDQEGYPDGYTCDECGEVSK